MKTTELIELLKARLETHGDREVYLTWENTEGPFGPEDVYLAKDGCLYINADAGQYKDIQAVDPTEGEQ